MHYLCKAGYFYAIISNRHFGSLFLHFSRIFMIAIVIIHYLYSHKTKKS